MVTIVGFQWQAADGLGAGKDAEWVRKGSGSSIERRIKEEKGKRKLRKLTITEVKEKYRS